MQKEFKFELGQRVFILGRSGLCHISGRGRMKFASKGKMNFYVLEGGHCGFHSEISLISRAEARILNNGGIA